MPTDYSLDVRKSIVANLKAFAPLTARISAARIYGEEAPADPQWPFIRYGLSDAAAFEATGWDGSEHDVAIHAFVNGPYTDNIEKAVTQIVEAMKGWQAPSGLGIVTAEWIGKAVIRDNPGEEQSKYHAIIRFAIAVAG